MRTAATAAAAALLAACAQSAADPRGVAEDEVLLQVVASGRAENRPDEARFTAGVETLAATAREANEANARKMEVVVAALEALGIPESDLQTQAIQLNRIDYGPERGRFRANNLIEVRLRDTGKTGAAVAAASEAGANVLSGPSLSLSDREAGKNAAYAAAYRAARARAEAYAEAAGLEVARILAIRDGGESGGPMPYYPTDAVMAEQAAPPPPVSAPFRAGTDTQEVRVRVDFALAEE